MAFSPETYALLKGIAIDAAASASTASDAADTATGAAEQAAASAAASAANSGLAPAFDPDTPYVVGDLVLYSGKVYRFTAAHTGAWDAADVEQTTLGEEVEALDAAKADKTDVATADAALEQMILASFPNDTISNVSVASFPDGADNIPVKALAVNIDPAQAAGTPTPENPLPISGRTGANVVRSSASIIPKSNVYANSSVSIVTGNKTMLRRDFKDSSTNSNIGVLSDIFDVYDHLPAGRYKFTGAITASKTIYSVTARISDQRGVEYVDIPMNGQSFDVGNDWLLIALRVYTANGSASWSVGDWYEISNFSLGVESTTYPISWQSAAGTVYGGTLRDNGNGTWTLAKDAYFLNPTVDTYKEVVSNRIKIYMNATTYKVPSEKYKKCTHLLWGSEGENYYYIVSGADNNVVYIHIDGVTDTVDHFNAWLTEQQQNGTPFGIMAERNTPQTYQLTAESVKTLLGANNIFADCGDIAEITYRADVGLYIAKKLAEA